MKLKRFLLRYYPPGKTYTDGQIFLEDIANMFYFTSVIWAVRITKAVFRFFWLKYACMDELTCLGILE